MNPEIAPPLRLNDCFNIVTDGAAHDPTNNENAANFPNPWPCRARACGMISCHVRRDFLAFEGPDAPFVAGFKRPMSRLRTSISPSHDWLPLAELLTYEAMGLAPKVQGRAPLETVVLSCGRCR